MVLLAAFACSETTEDPVASAAPEKPHHLTVSKVWNVGDIAADFPGTYSIDDSQEGASATPYILVDPLTGNKDFCRDHFKPIDLHWDGGDGLMSYHLDPPLLFRGYRSGTYKSNRGLVFQKAIYETIQSSEATDRAGNVWRFKGRFNALCRGGALEIGPLAFRGQVVVSQDPVDKPVLVRRANGGGGCGSDEYQNDYDPYDYYPGSGDFGCSGSGGGGEGGGHGLSCRSEYVYLEVSYDHGATWIVIWEGYATVCE